MDHNTQPEIINRVAQSPLLTFDLEEYYHHGERVLLDIKENLYMGLMLREKDFRDYIKATDWSIYTGKNVAVTCTADAIVPTWAYMLLANKLSPYANMVVYGDLEVLETMLFKQALAKVDAEAFRDAKVIIKGCSNLPVPVSAYVEITSLLSPVVASLMYGEPCSNVPLYKRPKAKAE
jgi:hypothetical protein